MTVGPVQLLVIGFADGDVKGELLAELDRLREHDIVRLIDLVLVRKGDDGTVQKILRSDLAPEEAEAFGATVGALIGFGAAREEGSDLPALDEGHVLDEDVWYVDDAIPSGTVAAVALLEHRWAIPLRDSVRDAGGFQLAEAWIHPADLVGIGILAAEEAEEAEPQLSRS